MIPWEFLDTAPVPGNGGELRLYRRGNEFSIRVAGRELMNSSAHGSEDALAELACERIKDRPRPRVLVGGLGMGFTLSAALRRLGSRSHVDVAELIPAVVAWNRGLLAGLAGKPLQDRRVTLCEGDVARILKTVQSVYDAILLDVDNGPEGLTHKGNDWLYSPEGLTAASAALRPAGLLAVWSATPNRTFTQRLNRQGFTVDEVTVRARGRQGGGRHTIWLASCRL
ncbi:MAG: spermine/spermidine synthase domain-containing protein [Thermodesulfovibrionales bacterium]